MIVLLPTGNDSNNQTTTTTTTTTTTVTNNTNESSTSNSNTTTTTNWWDMDMTPLLPDDSGGVMNNTTKLSPSNILSKKQKYIQNMVEQISGPTIVVGTPQNLALNWLLYNDTYTLQEEDGGGGLDNEINNGGHPQSMLKERYALTVLYYSTTIGSSNYNSNGTLTSSSTWYDTINFLNSETSVCDWSSDLHYNNSAIGLSLIHI